MQGKQAEIEVSQLYTIYAVNLDKVGIATRDEQGREGGRGRGGGERQQLNRLRIKMFSGHL